MPIIQSSPLKPLVSILIPTHERLDYLSLALRSAQEQTYDNIEIIVSDNSNNTDSEKMVKARMNLDPRVTYLRKSSGNYIENWLNALGCARGEYVNFLMDDDLFHPQKVERMLHYFVSYTQIGLVTSFRQLIDAHGRELPPISGTHRLFDKDTVIEGCSLGEQMLKSGQNFIGGPTAVMIRRTDIGAGFGQFYGRQYSELSDLATLLELLHGRHCVYMSDALSYFRIHEGQVQSKKLLGLKANLEWLQLLCDGHKSGKYIVNSRTFRELLAVKLSSLIPLIATRHDEIRDDDFDVEAIQHSIRQAFQLLLQ